MCSWVCSILGESVVWQRIEVEQRNGDKAGNWAVRVLVFGLGPLQFTSKEEKWV